MMSKIITMVCLFMVVLVTACHDDSDSPVTNAEVKYFLSVTPRSDISLDILKIAAAALGQPQIIDQLKYGVRSYTIVYQTTFKGNTIQASGLILLPKDIKDKAPIVSVQHGTTFVKSEAPSVTTGYSGAELLAAAGFVTLVPDFIGYGESASEFHPYYDKKYSALSVIDLIKAAKEYLTKEKIPFSEKLFLTGYSEGGYVTLAAAEEIDTNPEHKLSLTAVAAGAGGYDLVEMLKGVTLNATYSYPAYLAFVLMSYNNTYGWNKPLTYFFKQPYADSLSKYMNGEYGGSTINSKLTTNIADLLNADFYARLKQADGEIDLKHAIENNTISGWKTELPIQLYHGTKDEVIPYQNSQITLENFKAAGSENVTLTLIEDGTHGSSFVPMMEQFVPWFLGLM